MAARRYGEGSVYRRATDQRWVAVREGVDPTTGRRRRQAFYGSTRAEAVAKRRAAAGTRAPAASGRQTLRDYLLGWLDAVAAPRLKPLTLASYRQIVQAHLLPTLGHRRLDELRPAQVQALYGQLGARLGPTTIRRVHGVLHKALADAVRWDLVDRNPADRVDPPRLPRAQRPVADWVRSRAVLSAARGERFEAGYLLLVTTGLRRGELLGLQWGDLDLEVRVATIRRALYAVPGQGRVAESPKSADSERQVPLAPLVVEALRRLRQQQVADRLRWGAAWEPGDWLFTRRRGGPLSPSNFWLTWKRFLRRHGLAHLQLRQLRRDAGSLLLAAGGTIKDVQMLLGHARASLTLQVYVAEVSGGTKLAVDRLAERLTLDLAEELPR